MASLRIFNLNQPGRKIEEFQKVSVTRFDIICSIGGSPVAEIASLKGWQQANTGIAEAWRVLLIDSVHTRNQKIGERVREALHDVLGLDTGHITLACFSKPRPAIDELLDIYTKWSEHAASANLLFCVQPGFAFLNVQFFTRLPPATRIIFNEGSSVWFGQFAGDGEFTKKPIPSLGVDAVLQLHGATREAQADWPEFPAAGERDALMGFVNERNGYCNTRVTNVAGASARLHGLWERRGRLFGALLADPDSDTQQIRLQAQEISALRPLQITVALVSANSDQREVWGWFGLPAARDVGDLQNNAERPEPALALPNRIALSARGEPDDFRSAITHKDPVICGEQAEALNDVNLVCWMSEDPLVTLTAIWTHRPERCWLLYDKDHKRVCRSVYRLLEHAPELPAAELRLVQSNKMAAGINKAIPLQERPAERWIANISPGSKVHALALAALNSDRLELYSIDNSRSAAVALGAPSPATNFAKQAPPLWLMASIAGGPLRGPWTTVGATACACTRNIADGVSLKFQGPQRLLSETVCSDEQHSAILLALRIFVSYYKERYENEKFIPHFYNCKHGKITITNKKSGKKNTIRKMRVKPLNREPTVLEWKGGAWLEALAAHALARLDDIEVCMGFEWAWTNRDFPKGEIDIVAAHDGSIYVFECKTGVTKEMLDKGRAQARNMASACLGRFAIPAVIVPWIDKHKRDDFQDNPVPVICLDDLRNKDRVATTLAWLKKHPTTFKSVKTSRPASS